jgi:hypothetical protein
MILVRDTKDRTGPVLRFSPAAWRGFAERVKRSLACGSRADGTFGVRGEEACFLVGRVVGGAGVSAWRWPVSSVPGSARYASRLWPRSGLGPGEGGRGSGGTGKPGFGGFRVPPVPCRLPRPAGSARYSRFAARSAAPWALSTVMCGGFACTFPGQSVRLVLVFLCTFPGHSCDEFHLQCGSGLVPPGICLLAE